MFIKMEADTIALKLDGTRCNIKGTFFSPGFGMGRPIGLLPP